MLGDLLSNRAILTGLIFFVVVVSGSLLYSWHVQRATEAELARTDVMLQQLKNKKETHIVQTAQDVGVPSETETLGEFDSLIETDRPQASEEVEVLPPLDELTGAFLPDDFTIEDAEEPEDVPVSPFGFGPYPEVPEDYPARPTWERAGYDTFSQDTQRELELLDRVLIKLWKQGERGYRGGSTDNGKVYPHYKNTAYVRYRTTESGRRYIARYKGDPAIRISPEQLRTGELPPYIRVLDIDSEGIDPYQFLDLK